MNENIDMNENINDGFVSEKDINEQNDNKEVKVENTDKKKKINKIIVISVVAVLTLGSAYFIKDYMLSENETEEYSQSSLPNTGSNMSSFNEDSSSKKNNISINKVTHKTEKVVETKPQISKEDKIVSIKPKISEEKTFLSKDKNVTDIAKNISDNSHDVLNKMVEYQIDGKTHKNTTIDPFLQSFEQTVNNNKKKEELESNIALMKSAVDFMNARKEYETAMDAYIKFTKKQNISNNKIDDVKRTLEEEVKNIKSRLDNITRENQILKTTVDNYKNQELSEPIKGTNKTIPENSVVTKNGIIKDSSDNFYLAPTFNGVSYSQNIYRIGDSFILEETSENGDVTTFLTGEVYRGGIIQAIGADMIKLKIGNSVQLISIGNTLSNNSSSSYNAISISMPSNSSVKNTEQVKDGGSVIRSYADVQRDRAEIERGRDINSYFNKKR